MEHQIFEHQKLVVEYALKWREWVTEFELQEKLKKIHKYCVDNEMLTAEQPIIATHNIRNDKGELLFDIETIIPISKKIKPPEGILFLSPFHIDNALKITCKGSQEDMGECYQELHKFMTIHSLMPKGPGYQVTVRDKDGFGREVMKSEIYVDVQ